MKTKLLLFLFLAGYTQFSFAQNWLTTGNSGLSNSDFIGTADNKSLIFKTNKLEYGRLQNTGSWRFGTGINNMSVDSNGVLTFKSLGTYLVGDNKYVFQSKSKPNYGMFFNSTFANYELRDSLAAPVFFVNADSGHVTVKGRLAPSLSNTASLGATTNNWKDVFMSGSIFNGTARILSVDTLNGNTATGKGALLNNTIGIIED